MFLRFFVAVPLGWILVPYLSVRYRDPEERNARADSWDQRIKTWVKG